MFSTVGSPEGEQLVIRIVEGSTATDRRSAGIIELQRVGLV